MVACIHMQEYIRLAPGCSKPVGGCLAILIVCGLGLFSMRGTAAGAPLYVAAPAVP